MYKHLSLEPFFDIFMHFSDSSLQQRFFISQHAVGYSSDVGRFWLGISEKRLSILGWSSPPVILFSPTNYAVPWIHSRSQPTTDRNAEC